jgi:hypothetical protein
MKGTMNHHDAQAAFEPTVFDNTVPLNRAPMSSERSHIENKIAAKRSEIARLAQEIRWLTMELETA